VRFHRGDIPDGDRALVDGMAVTSVGRAAPGDVETRFDRVATGYGQESGEQLVQASLEAQVLEAFSVDATTRRHLVLGTGEPSASAR